VPSAWTRSAASASPARSVGTSGSPGERRRSSPKLGGSERHGVAAALPSAAREAVALACVEPASERSPDDAFGSRGAATPGGVSAADAGLGRVAKAGSRGDGARRALPPSSGTSSARLRVVAQVSASRP
jgi:hypothetical protein